ncbi:unnamed protein product [Kluyveromyces dobzhanskii CBS 2104]|uniref:WGS project CCBQ000000000 data, contig 00010 n=1 Tax=Kluyveromyces dobzhanskii CBS 2104 TaxID=1427455 RepID=A0A0A8LCV5_9SACH|nr:unnamed protein product [Kluyveromyces dobzhanskii CBS 2104]
MPKLVARPVENASNLVKALAQSKKPIVAHHEQQLELNYGNYGTSMIKPNPYERPVTLEHHRLRGVIGSIRMYQIINKLENHNSEVYRCPYFTLHFYPPEHFMGLARKSSPAIHIHYQQSYLLNGNLPNGKSLKENMTFMRSKSFAQTSNSWNKVLGNSNSLIPKQWAYYRVAVRKFLRPTFYDSWKQFGAPDGLYLYKIDVFTDRGNREVYGDHVKRSVEEASKLDLNKFVLDKRGRNWVEESNDRVRLNTVNNLLRQEMAQFRYGRVAPNSES